MMELSAHISNYRQTMDETDSPYSSVDYLTRDQASSSAYHNTAVYANPIGYQMQPENSAGTMMATERTMKTENYDDINNNILEEACPNGGQGVPDDLEDLNVTELVHYQLDHSGPEDFYPTYSNPTDHSTDPPYVLDSSMELEDDIYTPLSTDCPPSPEPSFKFELPSEAQVCAQPLPCHFNVKEDYRYFKESSSERLPTPHHMPYVQHTGIKHENKGLRFRRTKDAKLWEFLWDLLEKRIAEGAIKWLAKERGVFKIINSGKVAKLWGDHKKKSNMRYEFMARAIRFYYKSGIMSRIPNQRLTYQFGPVAFDLKRSGR